MSILPQCHTFKNKSDDIANACNLALLQRVLIFIQVVSSGLAQYLVLPFYMPLKFSNRGMD